MMRLRMASEHTFPPPMFFWQYLSSSSFETLPFFCFPSLVASIASKRRRAVTACSSSAPRVGRTRSWYASRFFCSKKTPMIISTTNDAIPRYTELMAKKKASAHGSKMKNSPSSLK